MSQQMSLRLAVIALEVLPMLEEEARKREYAGVNQYSRGVQLVAQGSTGKSRDKAAELFGINRQYISDAKMIAQKAKRGRSKKKRD